ncbi:MAG TPA: peptidylprolyl isomerase [Acidimicrobiales bacterium]|nr:peptidylprolyl isomerase [Acidimicrobiales bacterium]
MLRRLLTLGIAGVAVAVASAACDPVTPYAAVVNGHAISQAELNSELQAIHDSPAYMNALASNQLSVEGQGAGTFGTDFVDRVLSRQIYLVLVAQELASRHVAVTAADKAQAQNDIVQSYGPVLSTLPASYRTTLTDREAEVVALQNAVAQPVTPQAVTAYYNAHKSQFVTACVSHILVASQAQAEAALAQIKAGTPFAAVAKSMSTDTGSASQGGNLGCGPADQYVASFAHAVETLPVGQLSAPVQSQFGWHVILVSSRTQETLAQAQPAIEQQLSQDAQNSVNALLDGLVRKASITIDSRYGHFVVAGPGGQAGVVGPTPPPAAFQANSSQGQ